MTLEDRIAALAQSFGASIGGIDDRLTALENAPGGGATASPVKCAKGTLAMDFSENVNQLTLEEGGTVCPFALADPPSWVNIAPDYVINFPEPGNFLVILKPGLMTEGVNAARGNLGWTFNGESLDGSGYIRSSSGHNHSSDTAIWSCVQGVSSNIVAGKQGENGPLQLEYDRTQLIFVKLN